MDLQAVCHVDVHEAALTLHDADLHRKPFLQSTLQTKIPLHVTCVAQSCTAHPSTSKNECFIVIIAIQDGASTGNKLVMPTRECRLQQTC